MAYEPNRLPLSLRYPSGGDATPLPPYGKRREELLKRLAERPYYVTTTNPKGRPVFKRELADLATMVKEGLVKRERAPSCGMGRFARGKANVKSPSSRRVHTRYVLVNPPDHVPMAQPEPYKKRREANAEFHDANSRVHRRTRHKPTTKEES